MIRLAKQSDLIAIYRMIKRAASSHRILPRSKTELSEVIKYFFVYDKSKEIIGCCALEIYNKKIAEIRSLVVNEKYQKLGIGKKLIEACLIKAKEAKLREVLSITDKVDFFKKMGFDTCLNKQYAMFIHP